MLVLESQFERTVSCFENARELSPDDIYGYITHVQTIVEAARCVRNAAKVTSVADLTSFANDWMTEQITIANVLLDDAVQLYGRLDRQDDYLEKCLADIKKLYGDLDGVVRVWEINNAQGKSSPYGRRALAQAYFVRGGRSWRGLTDDELRRAAALAEQNLRLTSAREEDFRLWFEASKLLTGFDVLNAAAQLELWSARLPSWRATYYKYVLAFLMWWTERSDDVNAIYGAQEACARLAPGRQDHSYVWLSKDPSWCPLIADSDLGRWDKRERFWADPEGLLRVNGTIDVIYGPTQGSVLVGDPRLRAFFVPAAGGFLTQSDENQRVNFYLGFSPSGLRAWDVQRGHDSDAASRAAEAIETTPEVSRPRHAAFEAVQLQRVSALERSRLKSVVLALLKTASARGNETSLTWLEERVYAILGLTRDAVKAVSVRGVIDSLPDVTVHESQGDIIIRTRTSTEIVLESAKVDDVIAGYVLSANDDESWGLLLGPSGTHYRFDYRDIASGHVSQVKRAQIVTFTPSHERRGDRAIKVELADATATLYNGAVVSAANLREMVIGEIRDYLESLHAKGESITCPVPQLEEHLDTTFIGPVPLFRRLGASAMRQFLHGLDWLTISGKAGRQVVTINEHAFFSRNAATPRVTLNDSVEVPARKPPVGGFPNGEVSSAAAGHPPQVSSAGNKNASGPSLEDRFILAGVVAELRWSETALALQQIGPALKARLGDERYAAYCRPSGLRGRIAADPVWTLEEAKPGLEVIKTRLDDPTEELMLTLHLLLGEKGSGATTLARLGAALRTAVGERRYAELKGSRLQDLISKMDGWSTDEVAPNKIVVHPPHMPK